MVDPMHACRYMPFGDETLDPVKQTEPDNKESFTVFRPVGEFELERFPTPLLKVQKWPDAARPVNFRATLLEYYEQVLNGVVALHVTSIWSFHTLC